MMQIRVNSDNLVEALSFVSELTGVKEVDIMSKGRYRDNVVARHFVRYYLRKNFNMTFESIGDLTKGHHASVIHSVKYVEDYSLYDKTYRMYKESIDNRFVAKKFTTRDRIYRILSSNKNKEFKCNAILALIQEKNESERAVK